MLKNLSQRFHVFGYTFLKYRVRSVVKTHEFITETINALM